MNSLPTRQLSNGVVDTFIHTTEQYLTYDVNAKIQDRFAKGILLTLIEEDPKLFNEQKNNAVNANIMWSATHMIGHEITTTFGLEHAQTLAITLPRMMWEMRQTKEHKFLQYADRVWGITEGNVETRIKKVIKKLKISSTQFK